jgi:hypothetical protein
MIEMRVIPAGVGVVLSAFTVMAGCGGATARPPVTLDQFTLQLVQTICHKIFTCCDATEIATLDATLDPTLDPTIVDEASCRTHYEASSSARMANNQALIDAGLTGYDGNAARACLDTIAALSCAQWAGDLSLTRFPICSRVLVGKGAPGTVCASSGECASGYCGSGPTGMTPACAAPANRGESCEFAACVPGLGCIEPPSGGPRTCGDPGPDFSSCTFDSDCTSGFCIADGTSAMFCGVPTTCNGV